MRPRLALVPGEPAGIGPELVVRAAQQRLGRIWSSTATPRHPAGARGDALGLPLACIAAAMPRSPRSLEMVDIPHPAAAAFGSPNRQRRAVVAALTRAAHACLDGRMPRLGHRPGAQGRDQRGRHPYTGTTGLLAAQAGCEVVMMLANPTCAWRWRPRTCRCARCPTRSRRTRWKRPCASCTPTCARHFGIAAPRIAVLGLNPHAGEGGHLGREELDVIIPVLERLRAEGMRWSARCRPTPLFLPQTLRGFDAVLAMYHDQGLPVLKHASFGGGQHHARPALSARRSTTAPRSTSPAAASPIRAACSPRSNLRRMARRRRRRARAAARRPSSGQRISMHDLETDGHRRRSTSARTSCTTRGIIDKIVRGDRSRKPGERSSRSAPARAR
jgi:4-hydroxythreonine-4-phosphate dehydrogenase